MGQRRSGKPLNQVVVDASVLLKVVLPAQNEQDTLKALFLFKLFLNNKLAVMLPSFWSFEVGNTLIRKLADEMFEEKFLHLLSQPFKVYQFSPKENVEIGYFAKLNQVSFYDASYHLLAKFTDSIFVTADKKYFKRFAKDKNIALLWDLKL